MSKVSIVRCEEYEEDKVERALRESLELIGGLEKIVKPGDRVLLKVNMLMATPPKDAVTTHPAVLRAAVKLVQERGGLPLVGDSPGNAYANIEKALEVTGFKQICRETGAEIMKFGAKGVESLACPDSDLLPNLHISREVLGVDTIISLPKLKTHNYTLFTGAVKNMFGAVTGFHKGQFHLAAPHPVDFARLIVDIFSLVKPKLAIMDGIIGMEGHGPSGGEPKKIGVIMASEDCVSLDSVSANIIGYEPHQIDIIRIASERGLGKGNLEDIEIIGAPLEEVKVKDFELASLAHNILKSVPRFLYRPLKFLTTKYIKIYPSLIREKCVSCQICQKGCPAKAITMVENYPLLDYDKCIKCYCCHELCPERAFKIERSWLARKWSIGPQ